MANGGPRPGSGRKPGSRNKTSEEIRQKIQELIENGEAIDPIEGLAIMGKKWYDVGTLEAHELAAKCFEKAAPYLYPKLTSVDVAGNMTVGLGLADIVRKAVED